VAPTVPDTVEDVQKGLADNEYLADEGLATSIFLALRLQRPLLLEGEAGVGKTEVAKVLSRWTLASPSFLSFSRWWERVDAGMPSSD